MRVAWCVAWLIHILTLFICICDETHLCVWHVYGGSFIFMTWLIHWLVCGMTHSYLWHDAFICVTRLIHACDMVCGMTHSYYDRTWLVYMCDKTHSCVWHGVWHDSFIFMTWLIHMCDATSHVKCHTYESWHLTWDVASHMWMSHVIKYEWVMSYSYLSQIFKCVIWRLMSNVMSHMWHDSRICATWLLHMCDITHSCMCTHLHCICLLYLCTCRVW